MLYNIHEARSALFCFSGMNVGVQYVGPCIIAMAAYSVIVQLTVTNFKYKLAKVSHLSFSSLSLYKDEMFFNK